MKHRILVLDDDELDLEVIRELLEESGHQVRVTTDSEEALAYVRQNRGKLSLAIVDFNIPGTNGAEIAKRLRELDSELSIATYSGDSSEKTFEIMMAAGSDYFIQKGLEPRKLLAIINTFCKRYEESHQTVLPLPITDVEASKIQSVGMTGISRHLLDVADLIYLFAEASETVLIRGENGTGKELVARAIHQLSKRRGDFIVVNCGAIAPELMESEIFGHEKGAFTGAIRAKQGLAKAADRGTLFLDEIGDLPLNLQVKLLRFLQEGEIKAVGSEHTERVDTRIVAATNVNLEQAVATGKFRQDLYYRLKVLPIDLLPLRQRKEDIKPLLLRFVDQISKERGKKKEFLEETVKIMQRYDWPGNIRELEHEVRRLMVIAKDKIQPEDLDPVIRGEAKASNSSTHLDLEYESFKAKQNEEERQYLLKKYSEVGSIRKLARDVLKISNSTLQGRLRALGIVLNSKN